MEHKHLNILILMKNHLFHILCFLLTKLSLRSVHLLGGYLGRIYFFFAKNDLNFLKVNLINSSIFIDEDVEKAINKNIQELGKSIIETFYIWGQSQKDNLKLIRRVYGGDLLNKAEKSGKGIIFLTPHLGCFEITSIFYGALKPITILYRKARKDWMDDLMVNGRMKGMVSLATPNIRGLKKILLALKNGEAVGILPDQVADKGQGEFANFFGKPAYTMVLIKKLIQKTDANIVMAYGERLSDGAGYNIHLEKIDKKDITSTEDLNKQIERFIRKKPTQYLWSYDRYKKIS